MPCVFDWCRGGGQSLSRHLQNSHGWAKEDARVAVYSYGVQARKARKGKDYHKERVCPWPGCGVRSTRIDKHLLRGHNMKSSDPHYKSYCKVASAVEEVESLETSS